MCRANKSENGDNRGEEDEQPSIKEIMSLNSNATVVDFFLAVFATATDFFSSSSGGDGMMNDNLIVMTIILDRDQNHFFPIRGSSIHRATLGYAA